MCVNDVCDKIDWMENGWMENGLSGCGCGKWMDVESGSGKWKVESGGWRGSGSHTTLEGKFEWTPFIVHVILIKKTIYAEKYVERNVVKDGNLV